MNLNFKVLDLAYDRADKINLKCTSCSFWVDGSRLSFFEDLNTGSTLWDTIKSKFFELKSQKNKKKFLPCFIQNGGIAKVAFSGKKSIGILLAGRYYLFPKLKLFNFYPPDPNSIFLSCIYVLPHYRNLGVGKKLLISLEKDLIKHNISSIESAGKRLNDDIDIDEFVNSPLMPVKFLIKNGFYIKNNDEHYPLLRLDLSSLSIAEEFSAIQFAFNRLSFKKAVKKPATFRQNCKK